MDASAAADFLLKRPGTEWIAERLAAEQSVAPAHFDAEVLSAVRRSLARQMVTTDQATSVIDLLVELPVERRPLAPLLATAFRLRDRFSPFDALYVVLARDLRAPLLTTDEPLARAAAGYLEVVPVGFRPTQK